MLKPYFRGFRSGLGAFLFPVGTASPFPSGVDPQATPVWGRCERLSSASEGPGGFSRLVDRRVGRVGDYLQEHAERRYERDRMHLEKAVLPSPLAMNEQYLRVEVAVRKMILKGCRIVFIRLPTTGKIWELDEQFLPKELYWDRFAQQTAAETFHFKDHASLSGFECPDGSHLDYSDAIRFTRAFAELLSEGSDIVESQP